MKSISEILEALPAEKKAALESYLANNAARYGYFPLSFSQQRLWFLHQLDPVQTAYNIPVVIRLTGSLDIQALAKAAERVFLRHEVLRTRFSMLNGAPVQIISKEFDSSIRYSDLRRMNPHESEELAWILIRQESETPFDLEHGPLFRILLYRTSEDQHLLLMMMHHIVADAWSMRILSREIRILYDAFSRGLPDPLPPLGIQYADYALWQRRWLEGSKKQKQLEYWKKQLSGSVQSVELNNLCPQPDDKMNTGAHYTFRLENIDTHRLHLLCKEEHLTGFTFFLSVFSLLIMRYSDTADVPLGVPVINRGKPETEYLIGFFVNTLVMRIRANAEDTASLRRLTFRRFLRQTRQTVMEAFENIDLPFDYIAEQLHPERQTDRSPFFNIMFSYQKLTEADDTSSGGLKSEYIELENRSSVFDMTFSMAETDEEITASVEYRTAKYSSEFIKSMARNFCRLAACLIDDPEAGIFAVPLPDDEERQRILFGWNNLPSLPENFISMPGLFELQCRKSPDKTAVIFNEKSLSYSQLESDSNRLARFLLKAGITKGSVAALCIEPSLLMITGILGILKTGAAYLPLDPAYPAERLGFMIQDSGASVILTSDRTSAALPPSGIAEVSLTENLEQMRLESPENPRISCDAHDAAYIIYTSGSTGRPKGVVIEHLSLVNHNLAAARMLSLGDNDRVLHLSSICFDGSIEEIFPALLSGASVAVSDRHSLLKLEDFLSVLNRYGITVLDMPTSLWNAIVSEMALQKARMPESLRIAAIGGDKLTVERYRDWQQATQPHVRLLNTYGPTEATVIVTSWEVSAGDAELSIPIGHPIEGARLYILDSSLNLMPEGVAGELYIAGHCLGRCYLNRPDLTAKSFIPDPFSLMPGARMYRSGDVARFRSDGAIEIAGRMDEQVKIRGYRVEPVEIESIMLSHPMVSGAVVVAHKDSTGENELVAYFSAAKYQSTVTVPAESSRPDGLEYELKNLLRQKMPDFMIPSVFIPLEKIPLLPSGKPDRLFLQKSIPAKSDRVYSPGITPAEEILIAMMEELLSVKGIGRDDSFFDLGGHSLLLMRLLSKIRQVFCVDIPLREVFDHPVIRDMAVVIDRYKRTSENCSLPPIDRIPRKGELPLSSAQQRLWFLEQLMGSTSTYSIPSVFRISGRLNIPLMQKALELVSQRHEILRSAIDTIDGKPVLKIPEKPEPEIRITDIGGLMSDDKENEVQSIIDNEILTPFRLSEAPLFRLRLIKLSEDEFILICVFHHIISDGWSLEIFTREIMSIYKSLCYNTPHGLGQPAIQYTDYADWHNRLLRGRYFDEMSDFWKKMLSSADFRLELPIKLQQRPEFSSGGSILSFGLSEKISALVKQVSSENSATEFITLLSAFGLLLSRYSRKTDICVGTPVANRNHPDTEALIGLFVNTLVLRLDMSGSPSFSALIGRTRETLLQAFAYQDMPFEKLVELMEPERSLSRSPLFQVMFVYQNSHDLPQAVELPGIKMEPLEVSTGTSKFDITLFISSTPTGLKCSFEYNSALFSRSSIEVMSGHFITLLNELLLYPDKPAGKLRMTGDEERTGLIEIFEGRERSELPSPDKPLCDKPVTYVSATYESATYESATYESAADEQLFSEGSFVHRAFELTALASPDSTALIWGEDRRMTFRELNARANQMAWYLRAQGAGPGSIVGIALKRSPEMIISLLAILKSACSYLPIDPSYPPERIAWIAGDSGVSLIIADEAVSEILKRVLPENMAGSGFGRIIVTEHLAGLLDSYPSENPALELYPGSTAYVIYTSGSTGRPKGVMISHQALSNYLKYAFRRYRPYEGEGSLLHLSLSFDASVTSIFPALLAGRPVILAGESADIGVLLQTLRTCHGLSLLKITPAHLEALSLQLSDKDDLSGLCNAFVIGGEDLKPQLLGYWREKCPAALMYNEYGPTEATVGCIVFEASGYSDPNGSVPIGRVIEGMKAYILDENLDIQARGLPGELFIGGRSLSTGYLGRPDLTADRFIPDPFSSLPGERLYRTGDLVRLLDDGNMVFLGRNDTQIKVRGYRIEPGEIENALLATGLINGAAVALVENARSSDEASVTDSASKVFTAFYTTDDRQPVSASMLRDALRKTMPDYMIPALFVHIGEMPVTPNGKTDRGALRIPQHLPSVSETQHGSFETPEEHLLYGIWRDLLPARHITPEDNFFELGGDSILSVQIVSRANAMGLSLKPRDIFEYPTIRQLALAAGRMNQQDTCQYAPPYAGTLPLTPIQHWFFSRNLKDRNHWNQSVMLEIRKDISKEALASIFKTVVNHHDMLRAGFRKENGKWVQFIAPTNEEFTLDYFDLQAEQNTDSIGKYSDLVQSGFQLEKGQLFKAALMKLGEENFRLLIVAHHLIIDYVSWLILLGDIRQLSGSHSRELPQRTMSYKAWAELQQSYFSLYDIKEETLYWKNLKYEKAGRIMPDFPEAGNLEKDIFVFSASLNSEETQALLSDTLTQSRSTVSEIILAALTAALHRIYGMRTVMLDIENNGREFPGIKTDLSRSIGWFTAIYPLVIEMPRPLSYSESLGHIKEQFRRVPNNGIGYGILRYLAQGNTQSGQILQDIPESQICFNYLGHMKDIAELTDVFAASESRGTERGGENHAGYLFYISPFIAGSELTIQVSCSRAAFRTETAEKLVCLCIEETRNIIGHFKGTGRGDISAADFPLSKLSDAKLKKLRSKFS